MQTRKKILLLCSAIAVVFFSRCKKDPPAPISSDCANFSYTSVNFANWPGIDTTYGYVRFNPNNSNEILYLRGKTSTGEVYIVKRNLLTGSETNIVKDVFRRPDWSLKDWIVFNHADNQVWKVKSNGDSLTLLTTDMQGGHNAIWNPDGTKIAFMRQVSSTYYTIIMDEKGIFLDTLPYFSFYLNQWSNDGKYLIGESYDNVNVACAEIATKKIFKPTDNTLNDQSSNNLFIDGIGITPDSRVLIWSNHLGIYKTDFITQKTVRIKQTCDSKFYTSIAVSPDGTKIVAGRTEQNLVGNNLFIKTGLSVFNVNATNEIKIGNP